MLSLFIADDHKLVREGLRSLIETNIKDCHIVGEAENGRDAARMVRQLQPDIVLMDISMPDLNGIDAVKLIVKTVPDCKIIALSMHSSSEFVSQMLAAGAAGYLQKDSAFAELTTAIQTVCRGQVFLGAGVADVSVDGAGRQSSYRLDPEPPKLSSRERQVLQLVAEGRRTRDIADSLSLSVKTVETHRSSIMRKLGLETIAELTKYAIRAGITGLDT